MALGLLVVCTVVSIGAQPSGKPPGQYLRDRWEVEQGFPGGAVSSFAQTPDGYLWIGTEKGLVRYDGLTFLPIGRTAETARAQSGEGMAPVTNVLGLTTDSDGTLWLRLQDPRIIRYRAGRLENVTDASADEVSFTAMARGQSGAILLVGLRTGLSRQKNSVVETIVPGPGMPRSVTISVAETPGTTWIGTRDNGLWVLRGGRLAQVAGVPDRKINCLLRVSDTELWIGTDNGIAKWNGTAIERPNAPASLEGAQVLAMLRDRAGNIWIGSGRGMVRLDPRGMVSLDERDTQNGVAVTALFEDREGNVWIGSARGLERARSSVFRTFTAAEGQPSNDHGPLYVDDDDRIWFGPPEGGLYAMKNGQVEQAAAATIGSDVVYSIAGVRDGLWIGRRDGGLTHLRQEDQKWSAQTYTHADGLAQNSIYAVHASSDGAVWAATLSGGVSRLDGGTLTTYTTANGLPSNSVSSIAEGDDHTMWFATSDGLGSFTKGRWRAYAAHDGLPSAEVTCLFKDSEGVIWIGTAGGLAWLRSGRIERPGNSLPALQEHIVGVAADERGSLWLATSGTSEPHVLRVSRGALLRGELDQRARDYGVADGLRSLEAARRHRTVVADKLGRIWFSMTRGLSVVDPAHVPDNAAPAIVHIESVTADGATLDLRSPIRISAARQRVTFNYAGLSLSVPDRVKFRYRLDPFDRGWSDPISSRETVYTNLHPGPYNFRVMASNSEGLWNGVEASIPFHIDPVFWQTWWFRLTALGVGALGVLTLYRIRVHQVSKQLSVRFEERLAERTRIAQELHDTLLQGFVSASMQLHVVADRLPEDSPAKAPLGRILQLMTRVMDDGRNAVRGLRSSVSQGDDLEGVFSGIQKEIGVQSRVDYRVIVEGQARPLSPIIRDDVYRIGREALTNAFRHSGARSIELELDYAPSQMRLLVRDDGGGIDPAVVKSGSEGHWGLSGMRERAERIGARLKVFSRIEAGTEIELSIPGHIAFRDESAGRRTAWFGNWYRRVVGSRAQKVGTENER